MDLKTGETINGYEFDVEESLDITSQERREIIVKLQYVIERLLKT